MYTVDNNGTGTSMAGRCSDSDRMINVPVPFSPVGPPLALGGLDSHEVAGTRPCGSPGRRSHLNDLIAARVLDLEVGDLVPEADEEDVGPGAAGQHVVLLVG